MIRARIAIVLYYAWAVSIVVSIVGMWIGYPIPRWVITSLLAALFAFAWDGADNARAVLRERRALKRVQEEYGPVIVHHGTVIEAEVIDDDKQH